MLGQILLSGYCINHIIYTTRWMRRFAQALYS